MSERMASSMVTGKRGRITSQAGMSYRYDLPRSPMNICRIHSRYWTQYGRSSPSSFMMAAFSDSFTYPAVENRMSTMSPGASRKRTKITIDMPMSVSTAMPSRWATYVFIRDGGRSEHGGPRNGPPYPRAFGTPRHSRRVPRCQMSRSLVEPDFLHATEVVDRLVRDQVLHVRAVREVVEPPGEERTRGVLLDLLLELTDQRQPLLLIELLRLRLNHLRDLLVAVE